MLATHADLQPTLELIADDPEIIASFWWCQRCACVDEICNCSELSVVCFRISSGCLHCLAYKVTADHCVCY
jgi:hypothetical protein